MGERVKIRVWSSTILEARGEPPKRRRLAVDHVETKLPSRHLIYLSASQVPSETANSVHVMKMCSALSRQQLSVTLVADRGGRREDPFEFYSAERSFDLKVTPFSNKVPYALRHLLRALYALLIVCRVRGFGPRRRSKAELVAYARDVLSLTLVRLTRTPFVLELHDLPHRVAARSRRNRLRAMLLDHALRDRSLVHVVCITKALSRDLLQHCGSLGDERVTVLGDAADLPGTCSKPDAPEPRSVGYVGSFGPGRGLEIIEQMAEALPGCRFHLVGGRAGQHEAWAARFHRLPNVTLHGFVAQGDLPCVYRSFEIVLAPYQRSVPGHLGDDTGAWMSPLKIFEYMAYGKAIIASDLPVLREVLDEKVAVLVPPGDPGSWAAAAERLRDDRALLGALSTAAEERFLQLHTWDSRAEAVLGMLRG